MWAKKIVRIGFTPVEDRPRCIQCGLRLREKAHTTTRDTPPVLGQEVRESTVTSVGTGKFGGEGDGLFCGIHCGHTYAVRSARRDRDK